MTHPAHYVIEKLGEALATAEAEIARLRLRIDELEAAAPVEGG